MSTWTGVHRREAAGSVASRMPHSARRATASRSSSLLQIRRRSGQAPSGHAFFAYATNYLIDLDHAIIVDVEATRAIRQAEVGRPNDDRSVEDASAFIRSSWPQIAPMGRPRCSAGSLMSTGSSRTSRCSTSRHAKTAPSRARTSPTITRAMSTSVRRQDAHLQRDAGERRRDAMLYRASKYDCDGVHSSRDALRTPRPARCRARSTKALATWRATSRRRTPT